MEIAYAALIGLAVWAGKNDGQDVPAPVEKGVSSQALTLQKLSWQRLGERLAKMLSHDDFRRDAAYEPILTEIVRPRGQQCGSPVAKAL